MLTLIKIVCSSLGFGALTFLGLALLQPPIAGRLSNVQGIPSSGASRFIQTPLAQVGSACRKAATELPANLQSFSDSGNASFRRFTTSAQLQSDSMTTSMQSHFDNNDWLPKTTPNWIQSGVQSASRVLNGKTNTLARKIPTVSDYRSATGRFASAW